MQRILRLLLPLVAIAAVAGCGVGGAGDEVSSDTSVDQLVQKTFSGRKDINSGRIDLSLKLDVQGGSAGVTGPIDIRLTGPFKSAGERKLPLFDVDFSLRGAGLDLRAGATSTGTKGFVHFNGTDYAVSADVFRRFKQSFEQTASRSSGGARDPSLQTLGIDPRRWLVNPRNEGDARVGDTDVVKITAGVEVAKLLDDLNAALGKAAALGVAGQADVPTKLTEKQKRQVAQAVENVRVEIYTGKEDAILRRLALALDVKDSVKAGGKARIAFDLSLLELNEDVEIKAPARTRPFDELLQALGGLGLGGLGSKGSGASGGSGAGSGSAAPGGASSEALSRYTDCVEKAGNDLAEAQKCADLLAP